MMLVVYGSALHTIWKVSASSGNHLHQWLVVVRQHLDELVGVMRSCKMRLEPALLAAW